MSALPRLMASVPNPGPQPPPGLQNFGNEVISWVKYGVLVAGVIGVLICAAMIIIGRRNRNAVAQDGLIGSIWVLGGLALASVAAVIVGAFTI
jgi:hypothetical protein